MKYIGIGLLVLVGWGSYKMLGTLSPDAVAMAIGVLFGILAGVPTMLLMLVGQRRPPAPQMPTGPRYQVITGDGAPYVLDVATGTRYAIVKPTYEIEVSK